MADESNRYVRIEKLKSPDDYHNWKFNMKMWLIGNDVWGIVEGTEVLSETANEEDRKKFKKRDNKALSDICLSVSSSNQIYVRSAKNAKEAWDNLEAHFEEKTLAKKIYYRTLLYSTKMHKGITMVAHVNKLKTISEHLEALKDAPAEKDLVMILISSLPREYNNLITSLETLKEEQLTWNYVRDRVINEYERKKVDPKQGRESQDALYIGKPNNGSGRHNANKKTQGKGNKENGGKSNIKCHFCHEKGHIKKNCPKKSSDGSTTKDSASFCKSVDEGEEFEIALQVSCSALLSASSSDGGKSSENMQNGDSEVCFDFSVNEIKSDIKLEDIEEDNTVFHFELENSDIEDEEFEAEINDFEDIVKDPEVEIDDSESYFWPENSENEVEESEIVIGDFEAKILVVSEAKGENAEVKLRKENSEIKVMDSEGISEDSEVKVKDSVVKFEDSEVKFEDSEVKIEAKNSDITVMDSAVKLEVPEVKCEDSEVKCKDSEVKIRDSEIGITVIDSRVKVEDPEVKIQDFEIRLEDSEAKFEKTSPVLKSEDAESNKGDSEVRIENSEVSFNNSEVNAEMQCFMSVDHSETALIVTTEGGIDTSVTLSTAASSATKDGSDVAVAVSPGDLVHLPYNLSSERKPEVCSLLPEDFALQAGDEPDSKDPWWLDSGASCHMTGDKNDFISYQKETPGLVTLADKSQIASVGKGDVKAELFSSADGTTIPVSFKNVLYVPGLKKRLLSISAFTESGATVIFRGDLCTIVINDKSYEIGHKHGKLWKLNNVETCCSANSSQEVNSLSLWHLRLGHLNKSDVKTLHSEQLVDGIVIDSKAADVTCEGR